MSTNINITLTAENTNLITAVKVIAAAGRDKQQQKETEKKIKDEATAKRKKKLAEEGKDANGNPLTIGNPFGQSQTDRRPAANRGGEEFFLLRPTAGPTDGAIPLTSRKLPKVMFTGSPVTFSPGAGPSGSPALQAIPLAGDAPNNVELTNVLPTTPTSKYANTPLRDYTLQLFARLGETYVRGQREVDFTLRLQGVSVVDDLVYSFGIDMYANLETVGSNTTGYAASSFGFEEFSDNAGITTIYEGNAVNLASSEPKVAPGVWNHLVISKQGSTLRAFLNGQLLGTATSTVPANTFLRPSAGQFTRLNFGQSQARILPGQTVSIHGLRFDTKCIYKANFTPPSSL